MVLFACFSFFLLSFLPSLPNFYSILALLCSRACVAFGFIRVLWLCHHSFHSCWLSFSCRLFFVTTTRNWIWSDFLRRLSSFRRIMENGFSVSRATIFLSSAVAIFLCLRSVNYIRYCQYERRWLMLSNLVLWYFFGGSARSWVYRHFPFWLHQT